MKKKSFRTETSRRSTATIGDRELAATCGGTLDDLHPRFNGVYIDRAGMQKDGSLSDEARRSA